MKMHLQLFDLPAEVRFRDMVGVFGRGRRRPVLPMGHSGYKKEGLPIHELSCLLESILRGDLVRMLDSIARIFSVRGSILKATVIWLALIRSPGSCLQHKFNIYQRSWHCQSIFSGFEAGGKPLLISLNIHPKRLCALCS
jgi:hypothetical protein